ncbi:hypothetical protein KIW84_051426 [Lathyrus oleraceus]|uniref:Uncharacterized protein n=1 Tax=Pisum sativum TaxID=3888 RepID=A0A9D4WMN2_PEA|nr:hypothetical protein KIW84_051426 [Pisum sativum]
MTSSELANTLLVSQELRELLTCHDSYLFQCSRHPKHDIPIFLQLSKTLFSAFEGPSAVTQTSDRRTRLSPPNLHHFRHRTPHLNNLNRADIPKKFCVYCILDFLCANAKAKFDETVEAHIKPGIDSKRTELGDSMSTM